MDKKVLFLLLLILILGAFLRLEQLSSIPPGVYPDEAIHANQALTEPGKVFYPENNGREGLFINLIYLSFSLFGPSIFSLKLVPALLGILTILGLFLFTKELFHNSKYSNSIALLSSFFLALSFWHLNFSRIAFRAILVPLVLTFSFYFLLKGFRERKHRNFILSGVFLGLGIHTYIAIRITALVVFLILIFWFLNFKNKKKFFIFTFLLFLSALIIASPLLIYFLNSPQDFIGRATGVSIFNQESPIKAFFISLGRHLAMFNFSGDSNWRHNVSGESILAWPVGILFLIGVIYSFYKIIKGLLEKNGKPYFKFWVLVGWWKLGLLPGILTYEGIPHSLRSIGAIPPTFIFAGLGAILLYKNLVAFGKNLEMPHKSLKVLHNKKIRRVKKTNLITVLLIILLVIFSWFQYQKYFQKWAQAKEVENAFAKDYVEIGLFLNSLPQNIKKYVIINQAGVLVPYPKNKELPMPGQTVLFIERIEKKQSFYLSEKDLSEIKPNKETIIVPLVPNQKVFNKLSEKFPKGVEKQQDNFKLFHIQ